MGVLISNRRLIQAERWRHDLAYGGVGATYADKVLGIDPSITAYWPLWETSGSVAEDKVVDLRAPDPGSLDGTYTGVTLANGTAPDGSPCPFFDGANGYVNALTAALQAAFNGSEGTMMAWCRVANAGVWTDGAHRNNVTCLVNAANRSLIKKNVANNEITGLYDAGGVGEFVVNSPFSSTNWYLLCTTWSASADNYEGYEGGISFAARNTLGVWAGALGTAALGAQSVIGPTNPWHGWLAHCAIWDTPLTAPQIADLATV